MGKPAVTVWTGFSQNPTRFDERVDRVCRSWQGTKYVHNKCLRGFGVDCIHFGAAVLDDLYGLDHSKNLKSLPPDACVHNRRGVQKAVQSLLRTYPIRSVDSYLVEAGDLVITAPVVKGEPAGPSHVMVVGADYKLWHANPPAVGFTGFAIPDTSIVLRIYRAMNKELWTC